jgi:hypothetical protein
MRGRNQGVRAVILGCLLWLVSSGMRSSVVGPGLRAQEPPATPSAASPAATQPPPAAQPLAADLDARINELIQQLGAAEYATRERAQEELRRLRLDAFDALNEAQLNDDIEIALTARYLVNSMQVNWSSEDDSPEVKQLLRGYGSRNEADRRSALDQLAARGAEQGIRPLCRLARYEASEKLSKQAALHAMSFAVPEEPTALASFIDSLRARVGKSRRAAAGWLRAYADWLANDPTAETQWKDLVQLEQIRMVDTPELTSREITGDLLKWYADQLSRRGRNDEALAAMRTLVSLLNSAPAEVIDAVDWFRDRQGWTIVLEIAQQFPDTFQRNSFLMYRLAEAHLRLGDATKADALAKQALEAGGDGLSGHLEVAANLQHDGLFDWAELEYRSVGEKMDSDPREALLARLYLSEMLHELEKDEAAAALLQEVVTAVDESKELTALMEEELGRNIGSTKSRLCFFQAQHQAAVGNAQRCRELLLEGYLHDPDDADLLIGMFRAAEADEAWKQETRTRIETAAQRFREKIKELQFEARPDIQGPQDVAAFQLAQANNQLAWLIGNTLGDPDEAIRCSRASLALLPDRSGFLDTLGRCYYAKGDYASAVKYQTQAVADEPHSPAMLKQLALFQKALEEQAAAAEKGPSPTGPSPTGPSPTGPSPTGPSSPGGASAEKEGGKRP